uniref:EOG090X0BGA n=1 Tax=Moina brachiata TaxID=675436 RepID=A0A4Y7NJ79_9CRUS|nr:EOG090X0BGA [Moina brachiata]SVE93202.1 EOG090X0BGA [Moina brachiata]
MFHRSIRTEELSQAELDWSSGLTAQKQLVKLLNTSVNPSKSGLTAQKQLVKLLNTWVKPNVTGQTAQNLSQSEYKWLNSSKTTGQTAQNLGQAEYIRRNCSRTTGQAVLLITLQCSLVFSYYFDKGNVTVLTKCPGYYCGRQLIANDENGTVWGPCGACPRSYRVNTSWACSECTDSPSVYDWMYISFMALLGLLSQWYCIELLLSTPQFTLKSLTTHMSALLESLMSIFITLLVHEPYGQLSLKSCTVVRLADWYTVFHNPNPNYEEVLQCAQEAVYPLYSLVFVHYGLCVLMLLLVRPWVHKIFHVVDHEASRPIYAALYLFPTLTLIHGLAAGLIYYAFPYIIILLSLMSHAFHFASRADQSWRALLQETISNFHNLTVVVGHWVLHGFGLVALTMWVQPQLLATILILVPLPTLLYVVLSRFTDPVKFHND